MYSSSGKPVETRRRLAGLQPTYFQHPLDKAATENLAKVKGLGLFKKKFKELGLEKIFLIQNIGSYLRVSDPGTQHIQALHRGL
jgi:hypothetical protein